MSPLLNYNFSGNVRELENIIEHAFVLCRGPLIEPTHLPPQLQAGSAGGDQGPEDPSLDALEARHIRDALGRHGGNRAAAARELGIATSTLFRKIKALGIVVPRS